MTTKTREPCRVCGAHERVFVWCWDDGKNLAHNLYACDDCGAVEIERVWRNAGITIVAASGHTSEIET